MNSFRSTFRSPRSMAADCLRTLRKGLAQSETLYTDCGTAQHSGWHPSSAVCRPLVRGLQTVAARGVPSVCGGSTCSLAGAVSQRLGRQPAQKPWPSAENTQRVPSAVWPVAVGYTLSFGFFGHWQAAGNSCGAATKSFQRWTDGPAAPPCRRVLHAGLGREGEPLTTLEPDSAGSRAIKEKTDVH
jgi:hypothetical protein